MKCDRCGKEHPNSANFREIVGNIMVPNGAGGLVGQNIFETKPESFRDIDQLKVEKCRIEKRANVMSLAGGAVRIYSSIFCFSCFLEVCAIKEDQ